MYPDIAKLISKRDEFIASHDYSKYSSKDIEKVIGKDLTDKLSSSFGEKGAIQWFYSPLPAIEGNIPNEFYKINPEIIDNLINRYSCGEFNF